MAADLTAWQCDGIGNAGCAMANLVGDPNGLLAMWLRLTASATPTVT